VLYFWVSSKEKHWILLGIYLHTLSSWQLQFMTHNKRYSGKSETSLLYIMFMVSDMQSRLARSLSIFIISFLFCIISCYMMWQLCVCHRSCHKKCLTQSTTVWITTHKVKFCLCVRLRLCSTKLQNWCRCCAINAKINTPLYTLLSSCKCSTHIFSIFNININ